MKIKSLTTAVATAFLFTEAANATFTLQGGIGTFTTQGQNATFQLLSNDYAANLSQIKVTLTSAASETGTKITNTGGLPGNFSRDVNATFSTQLLGLLSGGTVNLSAVDSKPLNPTNFAIFTVSDSDTNVLIVNPLFHGLFIGTFHASGLSTVTGQITASTLTASAFGANGDGSFNVDASGATAARANTWKIEYTVPEPSAALLGGLGSLFLFRRRRN